MLGSPDIDHVLLTRFNLPTEGYETLIRAKQGWLQERIDLFERYCLPSVRSQTVRPSKWIIYFDPESPAWLIDRISTINHDKVFSPIFRTAVTRADLLHDLEICLGRRNRFLLTTNLDNDDALASNFVEQLRTVVPCDGSLAIYLVNGLIRSTKGVYAHSDVNNAFCSVLTPWTDPTTCWADWHNLLGRTMPVVRLSGAPAWMQMVHGKNVSNRVHGRQVSPALYAASFPGLLADAAPPTSGQLMADHVLLAPVRQVRDEARGIAKSVIQLARGRDGTDKFKIWMSAKARNPFMRHESGNRY